MRFLGLFFVGCLLSFTAFPQEDATVADQPASKNIEEKLVPTDKEAFEKAILISDPFDRITALGKFAAEYPESQLRSKALDSLASARATAGDIKLRGDEPAEGVRLFKLAVAEAPDPLSDDLFSKVLVNIPTNLFVLGQRNAAFEVAEMLEARSADNQKQILRLATFYIGIKYATGARRLAEKAIGLKPDESLAFQTMGVAQRLGFDLTGAEASYTRALELDPDSLSIKQNLGELKRSLGKPAEAEILFAEILKVEPSDIPARTGLILSVFEQNRKEEAEELLIEELNENPRNAFVMIGAANWYAVNGDPQRAVEHATQAISVEDSAVWAYIVLARGLMKQNKPLEAERTLLAASRFSASPTLSYELALTRVAAGFFREAVIELDKHFVFENGKLVTNLDGRIGAEADSFSELVALERKSVLFAADAAYDSASDEKLKELFLFEHAISQADPRDEVVSASADAFVGGTDGMKTFRQVYASKRLLDARILPGKASKMATEAAAGVVSSMDVAAPSAAVLADQLYEDREAAAKAGRVLIVPDIEKPTLVMIMRGRIEALAARSFIASEDYAGAEVRLKRAVSVLPRNSAWWRSSMWLLGEVYEKRGNDKKALESYAASYAAGDPSDKKRDEIAGIYTRVNGSMEGFDELLASNPNVDTDPASLFVKTTSAPKGQTPETGPTPVPETETKENPVGRNADLRASETAAKPDTNGGPSKTADAGIPDGIPVKKGLAEDLDLGLAGSNPEKSVEEISSVRPGDAEKDLADAVETDPPVAVPDAKETVDETKTDLPVADPAPKETVDEVKTDPPVAVTAAREGADEVKTDPPVLDTAAKDLVDEVRTDPPGADPATKNTVGEGKTDPPVPDTVPKDLVDGAKTDASQAVSAAKEVVDEAKINPPLLDRAPTDVTVGEKTDPGRIDPGAKELVDEIKTDPNIMDTAAKDPVDGAKTDPPAIDRANTDGVTKAENVAEEMNRDGLPKNAEDPENFKTADIETSGEVLKPVVGPPPPMGNRPVEETSLAKKKEPSEERGAPDLIDLGAVRPRIVPADKIRDALAVAADPDACEVVSSQDSVSVIANGGSFGIVVGLKNYNDAYVLRAVSLSPNDVSIAYEPDIGSVDGRAFFIVKSISEKTGEFKISFDTPCGKKFVTVAVH